MSFRSRALAALLLLGACQSDSTGPLVGGLLVPASVTVWEQDSVKLVVEVVDRDGKTIPNVPVVFGVEDTIIADISRGFLRFRNPGYTTVAVLAGGQTATINVVSGLKFITIASGQEFRLFYRWCGLTDRHSLWCYPSGNQIVPEADSLIRVPVPANSPLSQVSLGYQYLCGVTLSNQAYCWGDNHYGQLGADSGVGGYEIIEVPLAVKGGHQFSQVTTNEAHSCGLTPVGEAWCWGTGFLGDGIDHQQPVTDPVLVLGGLTFQAIAAGLDHTCGIQSGGVLYCWGNNGYAQLGTGADTPSVALQPIPVNSSVRFTHVAANAINTCALGEDHLAYCWGSGGFGAFGGVADVAPCPVYQYYDCTFVPEPIALNHSYRDLGVRGGGACALDLTGQAYCWGDNRSGEVGDGTVTFATVPSAVVGSHSFVSISRGAQHSCGIDSSGIVYCWGSYFGNVPQRIPFQP